MTIVALYSKYLMKAELETKGIDFSKIDLSLLARDQNLSSVSD